MPSSSSDMDQIMASFAKVNGAFKGEISKKNEPNNFLFEKI